MSNNPRVCVTLSMEDEQLLELLAADQGESLSGLCRRVLVAYCRRKAAEKHGAAFRSISQHDAASRTRHRKRA